MDKILEFSTCITLMIIIGHLFGPEWGSAFLTINIFIWLLRGMF